MMVDTTRARLRHSIGDQYVRGVLTVEDRVPVAAPAANASVASFPPDELKRALKIVCAEITQ